jgi:glycerate-2-kinase
MLFKNYQQLVGNGQTPLLQRRRRDVLEMLTAAVDAVDPYRVVAHHFQGTQLRVGSETFDLSTFDHVYLVGFGKASIGMARAVCNEVDVTKGVVVTNDPSATLDAEQVEVMVGGHPLPTEDSIRGAEKILRLLKECTGDDCLIVLISGGGSALFCVPRVPLEDLRRTTELLFRSGVRIEELNTIRKHLSTVGGGQLIRLIKGIVIALIISDVVNDPVSSIASGPTSPDPTTFTDAQEIFKRYSLWGMIPGSVRTVIEEGCAGRVPETPKADDPMFQSVFNYIVANNERACQAAVRKAEELGYAAMVLTTALTGEARELGPYLIQKARQSIAPGNTVFIAGGEPTVTIRGQGNGGRNQELVLSCVEAIAGTEMVVASCATDGLDGSSLAAGALADGDSLGRATEEKAVVTDLLAENNSYEFFRRLKDALMTGPTGTNVMDIQIVLR